MELENIKRSWEELNKKLDKTEIVNQQLIKEMIVQRSQTAQEKLFKMFMLMTAVIPILMITFPFMYEEIKIGQRTMMNVATEILFSYALFTQIMLVHYIHQMDIRQRDVTEIAYCTLMFRKWFKVRIMTGMPLAFIFIAFYMFELHTTTDILKEKSFWITLIILMPIVFYTCILKFRSTFRSLKIIEKSIADIKELKNEP